MKIEIDVPDDRLVGVALTNALHRRGQQMQASVHTDTEYAGSVLRKIADQIITQLEAAPECPACRRTECRRMGTPDALVCWCPCGAVYSVTPDGTKLIGMFD